MRALVTRLSEMFSCHENTEQWKCLSFNDQPYGAVLKMGLPRPLLSFIFGLFKQTSLKLFQQIYVKKCPSSIRCWDSNLQPLEHESPPITTRPGLPPYGAVFVAQLVEQLHLRFKSSHWHFLFSVSVNCIEKTKIQRYHYMQKDHSFLQSVHSHSFH